MSSLLATASQFNSEENNNNNNLQRRTRVNPRTRTIKKRPTTQNKNIEALMRMTADDTDDDDDESGLADFIPMKPELTRQPNGDGIDNKNTDDTFNMEDLIKGNNNNVNVLNPTFPGYNVDNDRNTKTTPAQYTKAHNNPTLTDQHMNEIINGKNRGSLDLGLLSNLENSINNTNSINNANINTNTSDINERLNYIITMLEEQRNTRTGSVTEELILYTFLGVFTIYIVDSFTRFGKSYVR